MCGRKECEHELRSFLAAIYYSFLPQQEALRSGCIASQFTILFQFGMFIHIIPLRQKPQIDSDAAVF